jgi:site-specific DNA-methyltransferase (adenine-specific)
MIVKDILVTSDNIEYLKTLPDNCVDLVVTSPPYDDLRDYHGYTLNLHQVGEQIHRVLKDGGICALVIQDSTKNFGKSLTSFRTIVDWCDSFGFKLFETVIYNRQGVEGAWWKKRFRVDHEYLPIFLKGERPQYFNKEGLKIPSKHGGKTMVGAAVRKKDGSQAESRSVYINPLKCPGTVMNFGNSCGDGSKLKHQHPAVFPDKLAFDMINCFCPEGGLVLDPFSGSGTSCVMAKKSHRHYIGIDISKEYNELASQRLIIEAPESFNF